MRSVAFATQDPPESPKTYPVGGEPLIWIVYFLFNGVDAENPTEGPEPRYAKMTPYAAAAQEYLKVHYEVHTETIAIQKYYCLVTEKALTLAQVEPGHQTVLSAPLVGKWMGGQIRKEALKKCYAQTTLRIKEWEIPRDAAEDAAEDAANEGIQAALADAIFHNVTDLELMLKKKGHEDISAATQMKLAEAANIAREHKVKAAVKGGWDSLEASSVPPSGISDPVLLAWIAHPKFPFNTVHLLSTEADRLLRSPESSGS